MLLDTSKPGSPVIAERVLLQPFYMLLALERNLCTWYKQIPTLSINLNLGKIGVSGSFLLLLLLLLCYHCQLDVVVVVVVVVVVIIIFIVVPT